MRTIFAAIAAAVVLACISITGSAQDKPVADSDKEGNFPAWNTWKLAFKGDWIQYALILRDEKGEESSRMYVRFDILEIVEGKIRYTRKGLDADKKETSNNEFTREWSKIPLMARPATRYTVEWRDDETELAGRMLKCRVASWSIPTADGGGGNHSNEIWYCAELPCGGVAKQSLNGQESVVVDSYAFNGKVAGRDAEGKAVDQTAPMPKFLATVGNTAVYRVTRGGQLLMYQQRVVTESDRNQAKFTLQRCSEDGTPEADAPKTTLEQTRVDWHGRYKEAIEKDTRVTVPAGEYLCDRFKATEMETTTETWINDGVIIKLVAKKGTTETTMELVKLTLK